MLSLAILALAAAQPAPPTPAGKPVNEARTDSGAVAAAKTLKLQPKTVVDGDSLQVILGQRAVFRLEGKNRPVLVKVEEGRLASAHPPGQAKETFDAPASGEVAAALDGSAEMRQSVLKVWNGLSQPLDYRAVAFVLRGGALSPVPVRVCAVPPGGVRTETWPAPVVAIGLARFAPGQAPPCPLPP